MSLLLLFGGQGVTTPIPVYVTQTSGAQASLKTSGAQAQLQTRGGQPSQSTRGPA